MEALEKRGTMATAAKKSKKKTAKVTLKRAAKVARKPAVKVTPKRPASGNRFHPGIYTVPRGHVSIAVPPFWTLRQTNDDMEIEAPSGTTSVIVTAFQHDQGAPPPDARDFLARFLETAPRNGRTKVEKGSRQKAIARYRDVDGDYWEVMFVSNGKTLLMATCNSTAPLAGREARTGVAVLDSLKLKARE
jgi:hypothetical protein